MLPAKNGCLAVIYHFLNDGFKNFTSVAAAAAAAVRKKNCFSLGEICPSNDHYGLPFLKWSVSNLTMHRRRQAGSIEKRPRGFKSYLSKISWWYRMIIMQLFQQGWCCFWQAACVQLSIIPLTLSDVNRVYHP